MFVKHENYCPILIYSFFFSDNMPTQLPLESTDLFGDLLFPHTYDIIQSDAMKPLENHKFSFPVQSVGYKNSSFLVSKYGFIFENTIFHARA